MSIASVDPASGETLRTFDAISPDELDARLARASAAFRSYRSTSVSQRAAWLNAAADVLETDKVGFARLMTLEMGKPITAAVAEIGKCVTACRYYAENAGRFVADATVSGTEGESRILFQPLGPVLAIMPWNFPFWQVFRFTAPALSAGNVCLLKHASSVPQCAVAIEEVIARAGFPADVFQTLLIGADQVEGVISDARVAAVTLTGSEAAGRAVGAAAGRSLKKSVLELGGSDPLIVMPTADLNSAAATAVKARMINNGQSCIAAKRFIVHAQIFDDFLHRFVRGVAAVRVGHPMDERTEVGPLATEQIRADLELQVEETVAGGARVLVGGRRIEGAGFYYAPTVLCDIPEGTPADQQELFGPVASVWKAADADHAIRIANSTSFGLGASAWTNDATEREQFIREIESGLVFINGMVASEPALPFGGIRNSGYGRELGEFGLREFVNVKTVKIAGAPKPAAAE